MTTFMHNADFTIENIEMFWLNVQKIVEEIDGGYDKNFFIWSPYWKLKLKQDQSGPR